MRKIFGRCLTGYEWSVSERSMHPLSHHKRIVTAAISETVRMCNKISRFLSIRGEDIRVLHEIAIQGGSAAFCLARDEEIRKHSIGGS